MILRRPLCGLPSPVGSAQVADRLGLRLVRAEVIAAVLAQDFVDIARRSRQDDLAVQPTRRLQSDARAVTHMRSLSDLRALRDLGHASTTGNGQPSAPPSHPGSLPFLLCGRRCQTSASNRVFFERAPAILRAT